MGWLAFFLYGMHIFSESIKNIGTRYVKYFLEKSTNTRIKGIFTGLIGTAILQSSTIVTLLVLWFIGANLITFTNAIGVIIGANIGTTLTSWIISIIGFKIDMHEFAMPIIGISGLLLLVLKNYKKRYYTAMFVFGFWLLLLGLGYMKSSFLIENADIKLEDFLHFWPYMYILLGIIVTIVTQSSTATNAIVLTALYNQTISFETSMYLMIGANIGTTFTGIMAVFGGTSAQKQLALAQIIFKTLTAVFVVIAISPIQQGIYMIFGRNNPMIALSAFHTIFNVIGALIFFPFISTLATILQKRFKPKDTFLELASLNLQWQDIRTCILGLYYDIQILLQNVFIYNIGRFWLSTQTLSSLVTSQWKINILENMLEKKYADIKKIQTILIQTIFHIPVSKRQTTSIVQIEQLQKIITLISDSSKMLKSIAHHVDDINETDDIPTQNLFTAIQQTIHETYSSLQQIIDNNLSYKEKIKQINQLQSVLQSKDKHFIHDVYKVFSNNTWEENIDMYHLTTINRYVQISTHSLLLGMKKYYTYIVSEQEKKQEIA